MLNIKLFSILKYFPIIKMFLWHIIFSIILFIYKIESGQIRPTFDEIFGKGCHKNEREEKMIKIEQNKQNEQNENTKAAVDQMDGENGTDSINQQKIETIKKFDAIKEKLKEKEKYKTKDRGKIERKIGKLLGANRQKIYKWKKELKLNKTKSNKMKKRFYEQKKKEFIERIDEFKSLYGQRKQKEFVKDLGICKVTFIKWKKELLPNYDKTPPKYSNEYILMKMKQYFEIKERNNEITDKIIAKKLGIGSSTLKRWKREYASTDQ